MLKVICWKSVSILLFIHQMELTAVSHSVQAYNALIISFEMAMINIFH